MENRTKPSELNAAEQYDIVGVLNLLASLATNNSQAHGFWDGFDKMCELLETDQAAFDQYLIDISLSKIALMQSELGEMVEGVRKPHNDEHCLQFTSEEVEMADCFIRLLDYAGKWNLRFAEAVLAKMEYNASRPYKHGKGA